MHDMNDKTHLAATAATPPASGLYRRVWRWHFFAGLLCLPFLFTLALTGAIYLFNQEIDDVVHADLLLRSDAARSQPGMAPGSLLLARAAAAVEGRPLALYRPADDRHTVRVDMRGPDGAVMQVFLDPASGAVMGSMAEAGRLMGLVKRIHSLTVAGDAGNVLIEIVAGWAIVLVVSGAYLWWPRGRRQGVVAIRPQARGRVWWRDLHAVTGAFGAIVILFLALTGMPWSIVWGKQVNAWLSANDLGAPAGMWDKAPRSTVPASALGPLPWSLEQHRVPASSMPGHTGHHGQAMGPQGGPGHGAIGVDRAAALFAAAGLDKGYRLVLPADADGVYSAIRLRAQHAGLRVIHLDQYSGKVLLDLGARDVGAVAQLTDWGVSVHQGVEYGLPNQLLMLAGCIAVMLLCVTGVVMWWKRRPAGRLAAPPRKDGDRLALGVVVIAVVLGIVFPLLGISMLLAAVLETLWRYGASVRRT